METMRETYRVTSDLWCCTNCYLSYHYGHVYEYPREWENGHLIYSETVNTLAENGVTIDDHVCREHDSESESCRSCKSADSGYTVFSKSRCDICEDHLAGSRYRLQASHVIELPSCSCGYCKVSDAADM